MIIVGRGAGRCLCWVLLGAILPVSGCLSGGATRRTQSVKSAKNLQASATELSSRNQSLLAIYSSEIEAAADKIISESSSPVARREALAWKADATPVIQVSLLNPDPVAAVLDTWVFIFQMMAYMEQPSVKQSFGEFHPVIVGTLTEMDAEMGRLVLAAAPAANIDQLRDRAKVWARDHPIRAGLAGHQSIDPEIIRRVGESDLGVGAVLQSVDERLGDLSARLDVYQIYLPKQARWQAQLLLLDTLRSPQLDAAQTNFAIVSAALAKTSNNIDRLPDFMQETRQAVKTDIEGQRLAAQTFVHDERLDTLDALQQERIAAVTALHNERLAATEDLRSEEAIIMQDVNNTAEKTIQDFDARSRGLIDHLFLRGVELVLLTVFLCSLAAWILLRRFVAR